MSLSVCAITGKPLRQPMASKKTGHLYEREVIEKHLNSFPYCPLTNQPMSNDDLIAITPHRGPFNRQDQSPMSFLSKLQNEYDILVVDIFRLRKSLKETEQELSSSLYQNQAASRVIARLLREKEENQNQIAKLEARKSQLQKQS